MTNSIPNLWDAGDDITNAIDTIEDAVYKMREVAREGARVSRANGLSDTSFKAKEQAYDAVLQLIENAFPYTHRRARLDEVFAAEYFPDHDDPTPSYE